MTRIITYTEEEINRAKSSFSFTSVDDLAGGERFLVVVLSCLRTLKSRSFYNTIWDAVITTISETAKRKYVDRSRKQSAMNRVLENKLSKKGLEIRIRRNG